MKSKKFFLSLLPAILLCCMSAALLLACSDDKDEDENKPQDSIETLCHVMVSEDVLNVADVTVHYLNEKGEETTEPMTKTEWRKQWVTTTLPARLGVWAHLTPKASPKTTKNSYKLKAIATTGYLFRSADGVRVWGDGWINVEDPYAAPERVAAADVPGWCSKNTAVGCEVDAKGKGKLAEVTFGGNVPFFGSAFCEWIMEIFGYHDYCD